ncbi:retropepsin-like aspartic protease [Klebsiella michiganensis]|uniref:retropepsin-like aspartic protease n=1 Tax=Klebsiella michiganensis TaxID=1134687 RepID=UPI003B98429B
MPIVINLQFMRPDGRIIQFPEFGAKPVIPATVRASSAENESVGISENKKDVYALIDTGADDFYIDEALVKELSIPKSASGKGLTVATASSKEYKPFHHALVSFTKDKTEFGFKFLPVKTSELGNHYQIIFGMSLVRLGCLKIDAINKIFTLTFTD